MMNRSAVVALRIVIALSLAGSLVVQAMIVPALWGDLAGTPAVARVTVVVIVAAWVVCLQVVALCVWRLVSMTAVDAVFSPRAFRLVDCVIGAISAAAVLTGILATMLVPGDAAPGAVGLVYGAALVTGGVALIVVVMKSLLRKAIAMRIELSEVV